MHGLGLVSAGVLVAGFLLSSIFFTMPSNVLSARDGGGWRTAVTSIAPQNWAFFTKDPNSPELVAYDNRSGVYTSLSRTPQGSASNLFGLSRKQRAQGVELGLLSGLVPTWTTCDDHVGDCLKSSFEMPASDAENTSRTPTICGPITLTEQQTTPWSFREIYPEQVRIIRYTHLQVRCGR